MFFIFIQVLKYKSDKPSIIIIITQVLTCRRGPGRVLVMQDQALRLAAAGNHCEVAAALLDAGADIEAMRGGALRGAASAGHLAMVRMLVARGADLEAGGTGYSALQLAVRGGREGQGGMWHRVQRTAAGGDGGA